MTTTTIEVLSQPELAALLGVAERTLEKWRYQRTGPAFVRLGARVGYRRSDVERWLSSQTVRTEAS